MSYIAGQYQCFFMPNAFQSAGSQFVYIGTSREGYTLRETWHRQDVKDDLQGDARPDSILQGVDIEMSGVNIELDKLLSSGVASIQNTFGGIGNQFVGYRARDLAGSICLTPCPGTPAAKRIGAGNSTVFYSTMLMNDLDVLLSSKLSEVPITFIVYPCGPVPAYTTYPSSWGGNYINNYFGNVATPSGCAFTFVPASFT